MSKPREITATISILFWLALFGLFWVVEKLQEMR